MPEIGQVITWEVLGFMVALLGLVIMKTLTGSINIRGLLDGINPDGSRFASASRVQLLIAALFTAVQYVTQTWDNPGSLPDIPPSWLLLFGGSQVIYLGSKFHTLYRNNVRR